MLRQVHICQVDAFWRFSNPFACVIRSLVNYVICVKIIGLSLERSFYASSWPAKGVI